MEKILTNLKRSYMILENSIRFYGILDKNAMESISIVKMILGDPTRFYGILEKNAMESIYCTEDGTRHSKKLGSSQ